MIAGNESFTEVDFLLKREGQRKIGLFSDCVLRVNGITGKDEICGANLVCCQDFEGC